MDKIDYLKKLPKIEVSFQDDFSGDESEFTLTPKYLIEKAKKNSINLNIEDEVLLWEKDENAQDEPYYLCNIGKIVEFNKNNIKKSITQVEENNLFLIDNKPVIIELDNKKYFDLSYDSEVFKK